MLRVAVRVLLAALLCPALCSARSVRSDDPSVSVRSSESSAKAALNLTILHANDPHARYVQTNEDVTGTACSGSKCYGGYPRMATIMKQARAADTANTTIILNAGDIYEGTVYFTQFGWNISAYFMNWLGFDVTCLGNHEFDNKISGLVPYIKNFKYPLVIANGNFSENPSMAELNISKSWVLERGGMKIGVVGYLTPQTHTLENTGNVTFTDEVKALKEETERLRDEQNVTIFIGLGHSGYDRDQEIAAQVPEIDIVIGGHSHSFLYTGTPPSNDVPVGPYPTWVTQNSTGKKVPVVQAYAFTKYFGNLSVSFDADGNLLSATGAPILLNESIAQDEETVAELALWTAELGDLEEVLGNTSVTLNDTTCRYRECNIGNMIADALMYYVVNKTTHLSSNWTNVSIAVVNGGDIKSSVSTGNITLEKLYEVIPYSDELMVVQVNGAVLREILEWSAVRYLQGSFLQFSGIHVIYNMSAASGSRLVSAKVRDASTWAYSALNESANYTIAMNSYLYEGGGGYDMIAASNEGSKSLNVTDFYAIETYIKNNSPLEPTIEGRIQFVSSTSSSSSTSLSSAASTLTIIAFTLAVGEMRRLWILQ